MLSRLKIAPDAREVVDRLMTRVGPDEAKRVEAALARAAGQDRNQYLTRAEVQAVVDAFEEAPDDVGVALDLADGNIAALGRASNADGVSAHFTFQESLEAKVVTELHEVAAKANGRPADVGMMIFQFQSKAVREAIAEVAKAHPNITFRIVADSTQASRSGSNALPELLDLGLPNVQVKFKLDFPYVWSASKGEAVFSHPASAGLNHHKGFVSVIDGVPDRLVTGSFNWSNTANTQNYEDLVVFRAQDASTRGAVEQFADEVAGFFNDESAARSPNAFDNWKRERFNALAEANGGAVRPFTPQPVESYAPYLPGISATAAVDLNGFRPEDRAGMDALVGKTLGASIRGERTRHGRIASFPELLERVPGLARLTAAQKAELERRAQFGSGTVSVNNASAAELDEAGFSKEMAEAIVAHREVAGDFESVNGVLDVPGMSLNRMAFARRHLEDDDVEAFFNSRPFGATQGDTGYGEAGSGRTSPVMGADGQVAPAPASVTAAATDLFFRAAPGQSIDVAMYGMSTTSKEFLALVGAAKRGVTVRVVLNGESASTVKALRSLAAAGLSVDVRIQTAKTMHEKFGVVGDDLFFGSANFSESSSTKHSENRVAVKNNAELSTAFQAQFELLWAKSRNP